jgi:glycosyltransferase involved in cell wall biosynthesis
MLDALRRLYGLGSGARASVIPNGLRDRFAPAAKEPFVLAAGRMWDEAKGLDALEQAAPRCAWPVRVAGADPDSSSAVEPLGRLEPAAMRACMESAAIFAHPARYEPFGLAPLEAGLAGAALVLGDLPSLREVWADAAVYVPPGDGDALAEALQRLIARPGLRDEMARRALRRARSYGAERMARAYLAEYTCIRAREAVSA